MTLIDPNYPVSQKGSMSLHLKLSFVGILQNVVFLASGMPIFVV